MPAYLQSFHARRKSLPAFEWHCVRSNSARSQPWPFNPFHPALARPASKSSKRKPGQWLSFQSLGKQVFDAQVAFTILTVSASPVIKGFNLRWRDFAAKCARACKRDAIPGLQLLHAPVYYGTTGTACALLDRSGRSVRITKTCRGSRLSITTMTRLPAHSSAGEKRRSSFPLRKPILRLVRMVVLVAADQSACAGGERGKIGGETTRMSRALILCLVLATNTLCGLRLSRRWALQCSFQKTIHVIAVPPSKIRPSSYRIEQRTDCGNHPRISGQHKLQGRSTPEAATPFCVAKSSAGKLCVCSLPP